MTHVNVFFSKGVFDEIGVEPCDVFNRLFKEILVEAFDEVFLDEVLEAEEDDFVTPWRILVRARCEGGVDDTGVYRVLFAVREFVEVS